MVEGLFEYYSLVIELLTKTMLHALIMQKYESQTTRDRKYD